MALEIADSLSFYTPSCTLRSSSANSLNLPTQPQSKVEKAPKTGWYYHVNKINGAEEMTTFTKNF